MCRTDLHVVDRDHIAARLRRLRPCTESQVGYGSDAHKALVIEDPDVLATYIDQSVTLEPGEHPAYCFEFDPQIAADFLARHAQMKLGRRISTHSQPVRQIQQ